MLPPISERIRITRAPIHGELALFLLTGSRVQEIATFESIIRALDPRVRGPDDGGVDYGGPRQGGRPVR